MKIWRAEATEYMRILEMRAFDQAAAAERETIGKAEEKEYARLLDSENRAFEDAVAETCYTEWVRFCTAEIAKLKQKLRSVERVWHQYRHQKAILGALHEIRMAEEEAFNGIVQTESEERHALGRKRKRQDADTDRRRMLHNVEALELMWRLEVEFEEKTGRLRI